MWECRTSFAAWSVREVRREWRSNDQAAVSTDLVGRHLCEAEVCDLAEWSQSLGEKEVLGLEISMCDAFRVEVANCLADHESDLTSVRLSCERVKVSDGVT